MNKETQKTIFSHKNDEWSTPIKFFKKLDEIFHFTLDPCATKENAKCDKYFTLEDDGLKQDWQGYSVFVNPPYSKNKEWVKKCYEESLKSNTIIALLIPARVDTKYFHEYCMSASEIYFIKGRLKFGEMNNSAPFPSMVVVFDESRHGLWNSPAVFTLEKE